MPQPHEQKLHDVVNSLTAESFRSFVAARMAGTSRRPPSARPPPPPNVSRNRSRRLMVGRGVSLPLARLSERFWIGASSDSSMGVPRATGILREVSCPNASPASGVDLASEEVAACADPRYFVDPSGMTYEKFWTCRRTSKR